MDTAKLRAEFHERMVDIYRVSKSEASCTASRFPAMVSEDSSGGVVTAKHLIHLEPPSEGYPALYLKGRLDLTVEAVVLGERRWHSLFSADDLEAYRVRLAKVHYKGLQSNS